MKLSAIFISIFICSFASAQGNKNDTSFNCIANWKKGEEKVLLIGRDKKSYQSGVLKSDFNFSYEAFITILDSSKEGYTIQWVFHLTEEVKQANPGLAESMPVYEGLKMIFTTTDLGTFKELLNWEEVRDAYVKMMEVSLPKNMDDKQKDAVNKAKELFNSREMVEAALIKEIILYHFLYGGSFTTNGSKQKTSLPSPFSEDSLPAILTTKITEISASPDHVKIITDQQIDIANSGKLFESIFRKMNLPEDSVMTMSKEMLSQFEIEDHSEYLVSRSTGWINKLEYQRTGRTNQMESRDSFIIETKK
jgi:hypothetical protein